MKKLGQPRKHPPKGERTKEAGVSRWTRFCKKAKQLLDAAKPIFSAIGRLFSLVFARFPKWGWKRCLPIMRRYLIPTCAFLLCVGILFFGMLCTVSAAVCDKMRDRIVTADELVAMEGEFDCILVLGCRVYSDGTPSPMLDDRISTAVMLYENGVSSRVLMSGDSRSVGYDETGVMLEVAIALGVPEDAIQTDPMGLSTYDSIARYHHIWEGRRIVIVTQEYHLYRALYIAEKLGMEAYGVSADQRPYAGQFKYDLREIFARCKDVVYALKKPMAEGLDVLPRS